MALLHVGLVFSVLLLLVLGYVVEAYPNETVNWIAAICIKAGLVFVLVVFVIGSRVLDDSQDRALCGCLAMFMLLCCCAGISLAYALVAGDTRFTWACGLLAVAIVGVTHKGVGYARIEFGKLGRMPLVVLPTLVVASTYAGLVAAYCPLKELFGSNVDPVSYASPDSVKLAMTLKLGSATGMCLTYALLRLVDNESVKSMPPQMFIVEMFAGFAYYIACAIMSFPCFFGATFSCTIAFLMPPLFLFGVACFGPAFQFGAAFCSMVFSAILMADYESAFTSSNTVMDGIWMTGISLSYFVAANTKYLRDQTIVYTTGCIGVQCFWWSGFNCMLLLSDAPPDYLLDSLLGFAWLVIAPINIVLYARRRRTLPKALRKCKFLQLTYLRKMYAEGLPIKRCQDLPEEAFGDPTKAKNIIILSHRWLHRYFCDVDMLRLNDMVKILAGSYAERVCGSSIGSILGTLMVGNSDVLLFFDFMCLPQIGMVPGTGETIQRTEAETELFLEALPEMGALYTMYDVLVSLVVSPSVHGYFESGWCFSEFMSAWLAKRLTKFARTIVLEYEEYTQAHGGSISASLIASMESGVLTASLVADFKEIFYKDLATKKFFSEDDRQIVRKIVLGKLMQRLLVDAVKLQDVREVDRLLRELQDQGLAKALNQACDEGDDTLLHIAVRQPSTEIVKALIDAGADVDLKNARGDSPGQFFMLPRFGEPARLCRQNASQGLLGFESVLQNAEDADAHPAFRTDVLKSY